MNDHFKVQVQRQPDGSGKIEINLSQPAMDLLEEISRYMGRTPEEQVERSAFRLLIGGDKLILPIGRWDSKKAEDSIRQLREQADRTHRQA